MAEASRTFELVHETVLRCVTKVCVPVLGSGNADEDAREMERIAHPLSAAITQMVEQPGHDGFQMSFSNEKCKFIMEIVLGEIAKEIPCAGQVEAVLLN